MREGRRAAGDGRGLGGAARREGRQGDFPVRTVKKAVPTRQAVAVLVRDEAWRVLFSQRTEEGLLCGLWELPGTGVTRRPTRRDALRALRETTGAFVRMCRGARYVTHVFSHFKLILHVYAARAYEGSLDHDATRPPVRFSVPSDLPLTRPPVAPSRSGMKRTRGRKVCRGKKNCRLTCLILFVYITTYL